MSNRSGPLPVPLVRGARRFAQWRRKRTTRSIPEELWSLATRLGAEHGVSRTCRALKVQYYDLRKRVVAARTSSRERSAPSAFVELLASPVTSAAEQVVELENAFGAKMRIQTRGGSTLDLAALSRLFLEQGR
ncbi:MAG: hypothetical protein L0Z62_04605 [Gemmataceae bacterium]|nr:hypothetical protein [Gemmataceae bacterium]